MSQDESFHSLSKPFARRGFASTTKDSFMRSSTVDDDSGKISGADDDIDLDPRALGLKIEHVYVDMDATEAHSITEIALGVYNTCVLLPTRNTWRNEEGARRELERDVERTTMSEMSRQIKCGVQEKLGGSWHVIYGRNYAVYCSHKVRSFLHFKLDGADVVVWRHGG